MTPGSRAELRTRVREIITRVEIQHARHLADLARGRPPRREKSIPGRWPPAPSPPPTAAQRPEACE